MLNYYRKYEYRIFGVLSVLLGLIPLIWLRGDLIAGEEFYAIDYARWGEVFSEAWSNTVNFGHSSVLVSFRFQGLLFSLFESLGFSAVFGQASWYVLTHSLTALFFYLLVYTVFKEEKVSGFILFISTMFYTFNPFFLNIAVVMSPPRLLFLFMPIIFLLIFKHFKSDDKKYLFYIAVTLFFSSPVFVNLPAGALLIFLVYFYFIYKHLIFKLSVRSFVKDASLFTVYFLVLNSWWILPSLFSIILSVADIKSGASSFSAISGTPIYEVFSHLGSWAFRQEAGENLFYFPYNEAYYYFPLAFLRQLPHFFVLWAIYHCIKNPREETTHFYLFSIFVYLIFLFLAKGTSGIGGGLYYFAMENIPFFWVFREPYAKFIPLASLTGSVLMALGMYTLYKLLQPIKDLYAHIWYYPSILIAVLFILYPFFTRQVIWDNNVDWLRSYVIDIPEEFPKMDKALSNEGNYIVYPTQGYVDRHLWPSGYVGNAPLMFTEAKLLNSVTGYIGNAYISNLISRIYSNMLNDPSRFLNSLERYNISGLIFQKDIYSPYIADFAHLNSLYSSYKVADNKYFSSFVFGKESLIEIIPIDSITSLQGGEHGVVEAVLGEDFYINYSDLSYFSPSYVLDTQNNDFTDNIRTNTYYLEDFTPGDYDLTVFPSMEGIVAISLNKKSIFQDSIILDGKCCSQLDISYIGFTELSLASSWNVTANISGEIKKVEITEPNLDFSSKNMRYYKKIESFDVSKDHTLSVIGKFTGESRGRIYIVERNPDLGSELKIFDAALKDSSDTLVFSYKGSARPFIKDDDLEYYIVVAPKPAEDRMEHSGDSFLIDSIVFHEIRKPKVVLTPVSLKGHKQNIAGNISIARSKKATLLVTLEEQSQNVVLQFKEAYNPGWLMVPLLGESPNIFSFIKGLKYSKFAFNIEDYSNGWVLSEDISTTNYMLLFVPAIVSDIFYTLALVSIAGGVIVFRKKSKW